MVSEPEMNRGYADLCLIRRRDRQTQRPFDILFELKFVARKAMGASTQSLREMTDAELLNHPKVVRAFADAEAQLMRYAAPRTHDFQLKCLAVVAVGLDRILAREVSVEVG